MRVQLSNNLQPGDSLLFNVINSQIFNNTNGVIDVAEIGTVIKIEDASGISNFESPKANYYPNPSNNELNISFIENQIAQINIINPIGQTLLEFYPSTNQNQMLINTSNLTDGLYLLQIIDKNKVSNTYKIEIKH
jgi:hypothetical protein